jgi:uncharacterized protein YciI
MQFVYCLIDKEGMEQERADLLDAHRDALADVNDRILLGGGLRDDTHEVAKGSLFVIDWPDRETAQAWLDNEPFMKAGVYGETTIRGYTHLVPSGGVPKKIKHKLWAFIQLDIPDSQALRAKYFEAHRDFLIDTTDVIYSDGPLYWDSDKTEFDDRIGSLFVVDFPDRASAEAWRESEPFTIQGVYGTLWAYGYLNRWPGFEKKTA